MLSFARLLGNHTPAVNILPTLWPRFESAHGHCDGTDLFESGNV